MLYIKKKLIVLEMFLSLGPSSDTYLCVSHAGCSCNHLLHRLCFPCHSLIAVVLLWVSGDLGSPLLAQQDVDDFCMALQPGVDQCTLATLISMAHLAQRGTQKDLQCWSWPVPGLDRACLCHLSPRIDPETVVSVKPGLFRISLVYR